MFERILVTTDLSERSRGICRFAAAFARNLGAEVTFLHVDELAGHGLRDSEEYRAYHELAETVGRDSLDLLRAELAADGDTEPELIIIPGRPKAVIVEHARSAGFDLVVVARRSRPTLEERLLGSTTGHVLRLSPVPVLVVPDEVVSAPLQALAGPVIAATDLHDTSIRGVVVGRELASALSAPLLVVNVLDWPSVADLMMAAPNDLMTRVARRMKLRALDELHALVGPLGIREDQQRVVNGPSPAEAIADLGRSLSASVITLPATGKGALKRIFLGSTSARLVKLADRPVMVMPGPWLEQAVKA